MSANKPNKAVKRYFGDTGDRSIWKQKRALKIIYVRDDQKPGPVTIINLKSTPNP